MAVTENGNGLSAADIAAVMGGNGFNGANWGDGSFWIIVLFLFALMGNGFGNGFGNSAGAMPFILNNGNDVQRGFDQQAVMSGITGLTSAVTNGFANAEVSRCNSQANILQTLNANQNAVTAGMNSISMGLQQCCCDNRAGLADLKYTVASEECNTRNNDSQNTQAILTAMNQGFQSIKNELFADRLDDERRENQNLRSELMFARGQASQAEQTAIFQQGLTNEVDALYNRLSNCPVNTIPVYGNQPVYTMPHNNGGCPCNGF